MGPYGRYILPRLVHMACSSRPIARQRQKVVHRAHGRVLEVGVGSGLNFPYYDPARVDLLWALDPSAEMLQMARNPAGTVAFDVEFLQSPCEEIELEDGAVDTVVMTYTLCTIPQPRTALRELVRVLKPRGRLIFSEHGLAPDPGVRRWQNRLNGAWRRVGGGCNLNRDIPATISAGGFTITAMEEMYLPGWRPATFTSWGTAEAR